MEKNTGKNTINRKLTQVFQRLQIGTTLVILLVMLAGSGIAAARVRMQLMRSDAAVVSNRFENDWDHVISAMKLAVSDVNRIELGDTMFETSWSGAVAGNELFTAFEYYLVSFPQIDGMLYMDQEGVITVAGNIGRPSSSAVSGMVAQIPAKGIASAVEIITEDEELLEKLGYPGWIVGQRVIDMNTGANLGYLFITVSMDTLSSGIPDHGSHSLLGEYGLVRADGIIIAGHTRERLGNGLTEEENFFSKIVSAGEEPSVWITMPYAYASFSLRSGQWFLVNRISLSLFVWMFAGITLVFALIELVCVRVSGYLVKRAALQISSPVEELTDMALRVGEGETSLRCAIDTDDEIGTLGQVFNEMLDKMQVMSEETREAQELKRSYELELLQQQIKPHFLYNTLDLIYIHCLMENPEAAAEVVLNLADFYRTSLSDGAGVVTMASEYKNITSYMKIQKERFSEKLSYEIDMDEDIMDCRIPKLTLQPLAENAINHGIRPTGKAGTVLIRGYAKENAVILEVEDTGRGMTQEMIREVLAPYREDEPGHFGLGSTNRRLKLFFGEDFGLEIESELEMGTTVRARIPREAL